MKHSHLRGLKLLFCATLALAIVLSLLPAQEAKALKQGQTCPDCGTGILIPISYNSEQHALSCSKTGCIHSASDGYIWENHHGGNTCTGRPICEGCGQEYGSALGHDWQTEWTIDGDAHYHACSRCTERKDEAAHNYVWTYVDDDTCKGVCECGAEITEAHYDRWASSCGRQPHCQKCDHDYGTIPEHEMWYEDRGESGHKPSCYHCDTYFFLEPHVGTSTCTEAGTCSLCGGTIPALGHDWATTLTNGGDTHYYACSRCDAKKDEAAHTYNWTYVDDSTHKGTCACGAETTEVHYDRWADKCGRQPHCEKCDTDYGTPPEHEMIYEDRDESGHKPSCKHCDTYFFLEPHVGTSTCTETGTCSLCGGTIPALGHDWATTLTNGGDTQYYACSRCDSKKDEAAHIYENWTKVDDSNHKGKCACGKEKTEPHSGGTATCQAKAKCEKCGEEYGDTLGHDLKKTDKVEPTCTTPGTEAYWTCQRDNCGKLFSDDQGENEINAPVTIKALGHDLIHHDAQAPTCTAIGWDAYQTCSRCDYTTYAEKPALGHSEVTGTAIAPTCTDNGLTEGMYCFRCGQVLIAQEDIPALGHDFAVTHRTITRVYFQCSRCRDSYWIDNAKSRNLLSSLVWNDRDENVEYTAGVAKANGIKVLTITPDAEAVEDSAWVSLRLKPDDVEQWKGEGIGTVAFQCGEVRMEISLSALTLDWFDLNEPFDYYVFTLAPEEDGTLVTVEAEIGTEKVAADEYDGITLVRGDTILEIVQNGIY